MPVVSESQRKAMYAALNGHSTLGIPKAVARKFVGSEAHDEDEPEITGRAAGVIFLTPDGHVLFLERSPKGDHENEYCFPGGMCEGDEEPEDTARREAIEEVSAPPGELKPFHRSVSDDGLEYTTFIQGVDKPFRPIINDESTRAIWRGLDDLPEPLHPGVASMLGLDMSEEEWDGLEEGLGKWIEEERQEDEHAEDASNEVEVVVRFGKSEHGWDDVKIYLISNLNKARQRALEEKRKNPQADVFIRDAKTLKAVDAELANVTSEPKSPNPKAKPAGPATEQGNGFAGSMGAGAAGGMDFGNDAKLSHTEVDYGPGKQKSHCSICEYYIKDGQSHCQLVADPIEPQGWCKLFTANQVYQVEIVWKYDGPWISCMSKDGERMYVNRNVPETVQIKDKLVNVDEDLLHHEVPEFNEIKRLLAEFEQDHARKPNTNEKKQIYLKAHNAAGTPSERQYCKDHGIDWDTLQAWFRGKESRIENLKVRNPPPDADVKPIPHKHGDLEIALDGGPGSGPQGGKHSEFKQEGESWEFGSGNIPKGSGWIDSPIPVVNEKDNPLKVLGPLRNEPFDRKDTPVVELSVKDLKAWQPGINPEKLQPLQKEYPPIEVGKINGSYVVMNGNHRAVDAFIGGEEKIRAKLVDFDSPKNKKYWSKKKAQDSKAEPEHTLEIQYDGDFDMVGFLRMLHLMGGHGSSRGIVIDDDEDYSFSSLWDGDGADKIHSAMIDGVDVLKEGAEDAKFEESKHPRKGGKFVKKGSGESGSKQQESKTENKTETASTEKSGGAEKSGSHAQKVKAFLSQPNVTKIIANSAGSFLKEHIAGAAEHHTHGAYMGLIHSAVGFGLEHLGASVPEALAASVVGYTLTTIATKIGIGPEQVHHMLIKTGKALIKSLLGAHELGKLKEAHLGGEEGDSALDAQPDKDVLTSIQRFVKILEKTPTKELIKQAKAPQEDEVEDSADPRFDLRTRKLAKGKGVRVTGRIGGYEPYEEVASTKRTMARWLREGREKIAGKSAQDEALWFALDQAVRASGGGEKYAFDRSVREYDADGRLHISVANISKANICPYLGKEIPDEDGTLNLEPDKVYQLLRPADELAKAASTFNGIPVLREHIPVSADDHQPDEVIGATGTDAEFVDPYLRNSLVIWSQDDIDAIKSGEKRALSCGYRYKALMQSGEFKGVHFDGRMVDIVANHLAVCEIGRTGDDIRIGDQVSVPLRWAAVADAILSL